MGFRIPRKSSDEVRSAGKYRSYIPYIYIPTHVGTETYGHADVVSLPTVQW